MIAFRWSFDCRDEAVAIPVNGFDDALLLRVVSNQASRPDYASRQGGSRNLGTDPDGLLQFLSIDGPVSIFEEIDEQIDDFRLCGHHLAAVTNLLEMWIHLEIVEAKYDWV